MIYCPPTIIYCPPTMIFESLVRGKMGIMINKLIAHANESLYGNFSFYFKMVLRNNKMIDPPSCQVLEC